VTLSVLPSVALLKESSSAVLELALTKALLSVPA
jgi:hypothetical protein